MECIYCHYSRTYQLSDGLCKCPRCKRKYSPQKQARELAILMDFLHGHSSLQAAKIHQCHYLTVHRLYMKFRGLIAKYSDEMYAANEHLVTEYDESLYIPHRLRKSTQNITKAHNFLTFSFEDKVYNIMMPHLGRYSETLDSKSIKQFLRFHKIAKLSKASNTITAFWDFFETFIAKYRGVSADSFVYYLKEGEFRFNYTYEEQKEILLSLVRKHCSDLS